MKQKNRIQTLNQHLNARQIQFRALLKEHKISGLAVSVATMAAPVGFFFTFRFFQSRFPRSFRNFRLGLFSLKIWRSLKSSQKDATPSSQ